MSLAFALLTSDPNLLRCELQRLEAQVGLEAAGPVNAMGVGTYAQEEVLLERFAGAEGRTLSSLAPRYGSAALVLHAARQPLGLVAEENTQPFRARQWLFAHQGSVPEFRAARAGLLERVPAHLRRLVLGGTDSEVVFALFLARLRETGRMNDPRLEAEVAGHVLREVAHEVDAAAAHAGAARTAELNLVATNGELLAAVRWGAEPLFYARLEGTDTCEACGLGAATAATHTLREAHRRRLSVAVASHPRRTSGWVELPHATALVVDGRLQVKHLGPAQGTPK
ncbi:class II glutamine amidotransferase [Aggregicoccus sp. 17bor-14]|uniref:class II glutamine amidotransferase n=1 Tax=Myxococcaceae TaxID=31 RepID=UPI00129C9D5D|nr:MULTISPECIES: class II glutamine amidotransferase [Myxococcaceae]MBF5041342.1 class II glutamine amidotransferase [Simulacricoccus sp. 17bor-14]MRI87128.1 class II glutamine amidotransferase [Aggregicoccus sp. 17bor-14]